MAPRKKPNNALVVRTYADPTTVAGAGPDDIGVRPLAGVTVTLTRAMVGAAVPPAQLTEQDGQIRFPDLDADDYTIAVALANFLPPAEKFVNGHRQLFGQAIPVLKGGEVVVDLVLTPVAGSVDGTVRMPGGRSPDNVTVEAYHGGLLVDSVVTPTAGKPSGGFQLDIHRPGLIEIRPAPSVNRGGRVYVPRARDARRSVVVEAGQPETVTIDYVAQRAEITVGAQLTREVDGRLESEPLDGVTFQLFRQGDDQPLRKLTTQSQTTGTFADLATGPYRVVAIPPEAGNGQRPQLVRPSTPEITIRVRRGQHVDLSREFEFRAPQGGILGSVVAMPDNRPVPAVAVVLSSQQQPPIVRRAVTNTAGEYEIDDLPPGRYIVALEQSVVTAFGRRWEPESPNGQDETARTIEVRARATTLVPDLRLVEEEHLISGRVLGPDGRGAPFVTVQIFGDADTTQPPVENVLTDRDGTYQFRAQTAGTFYIRVLERGGFAPQLTPVTVNSPTTAPTLVTSTRPAGFTGGGSTTPTPSPVSQDNDFPFLTQEIDAESRAAPAQPYGGGSSGSVGRTVERELREVLGWRPRAGDPKGFQAALQQAFTVTEVAGHTEVQWKPRSYSVEIQADLGAITGAQASLYTRAKGMLDQVLPLLDGLKPLRVDFDEENVSAIRAIVRSQLTQLVAELGVEGGPRVQRIDQLFGFLLGEPPPNLLGRPDRSVLRDPDEVAGSFGILRDRLGLDRDRINTIDEEQGFTNFLVVLDHVVSLAESWDAQRVFFVRGSAVEPFLGTQLVLLSRDLEVIAESVHEVEFAMDSVFLGPAERQTLELRFPVDPSRPLVSGTPPMFVSELLSWVKHFATEEGRQLVDEGGRQGVVAFRPTILLLQALVTAALVAPAGMQDPNRMPAAYRRQRVQRTLAELTQQLGAAADRVAQIRPPTEQAAVAAAQPPAVAGRPPARRRPRPLGDDDGTPPPPPGGAGGPVIT